jgi:antitoxin CcdA
MHMAVKKAVNLSLDEDVLAKARAEGINLSAALEETVRARISSIEAERWKRENAGALHAMAQRIEMEGVAGDEYRSFG